MEASSVASQKRHGIADCFTGRTDTHTYLCLAGTGLGERLRDLRVEFLLADPEPGVWLAAGLSPFCGKGDFTVLGEVTGEASGEVAVGFFFLVLFFLFTSGLGELAQSGQRRSYQ